MIFQAVTNMMIKIISNTTTKTEYSLSYLQKPLK